MALSHRLAPLALLLTLVGCSDPSPASSDASASDVSASDASDVSASVGTPDARASSPVDPALFDCRARAMIPARASTVPFACGTDPTCRTPQVMGHRGAGGSFGFIAPEDTLSAYRAGIALGIEYVETDPRPTMDGVLVNIHDDTVDRTTDGTGAVDQMTFEQVRALHIRADGLAGDFSCERVPTLREILETCRGRVIVVIDANKTDRIDLLVQAIREADAVDSVVFSTSSIDKVRRALAMEPRIRAHIRPDTVAAITQQLDMLAPVVPAIVELRRADVRAGAPIVHARGSRVETDIFGEDAVAAIRGDTSLYLNAFNEGADIVQSDRPSQVLDALRRAGRR
ncbi:MAG: glycerophosphodiester phosphodiesterase family protein [Myxococcaceae bacterium]|nr:MAG: glycerophosphodiester phosphodiesterase family protein [Myxococcaceae bacterium]